MAKVSAEQFSREGDKYIGRTYDEMDCQEFYERAAADAGLKMDLKGSNAWYREFLKNGWVGSPEECKKKFGSIPKGATLFIHAFDGGEEKRGYHDGLGNASHIGFKTGRSGAEMVAETGRKDMNFGDGAEHSSSSRGHVCTSKFADKTISGGGWNKVGLHKKFTYGEKIDAILAGETGGETPVSPAEDEIPEEEDTAMYKAILEGGNKNKPINIRKKPDGDLQDTLPQGSEVTVLSEDGDWCKIQYGKNNRTGYVKGEFVVVDDSDIPDEDFGDDDLDDDWGNETVSITLSMTAREASYALPVLEKLVDAIVDKVGRG